MPLSLETLLAISVSIIGALLVLLGIWEAVG